MRSVCQPTGFLYADQPCLATLVFDGFLVCRATEMDVTMIGLQNAGKTSLLRVLAVGQIARFLVDSAIANQRSQGGEFTVE